MFSTRIAVKNSSTPNINSLKIVHWNCNSIVNKIHDLKIYISLHEPDIISLNELKINEIKANLLFNDIVNYNFVCKCRNNHGGGVVLLIKNAISYEEINDIGELANSKTKLFL